MHVALSHKVCSFSAETVHVIMLAKCSKYSEVLSGIIFSHLSQLWAGIQRKAGGCAGKMLAKEGPHLPLMLHFPLRFLAWAAAGRQLVPASED